MWGRWEKADVSWAGVRKIAWQGYHNKVAEVSSAFIWWDYSKKKQKKNINFKWFFHLLQLAPPGKLMYCRTWWFLCMWSYPVNCFMFLDTLLNLNPSFCSVERGQIPDESWARTLETNLIGSFLADRCPFLLAICWCLDMTADQSRQINHSPIQI